MRQRLTTSSLVSGGGDPALSTTSTDLHGIKCTSIVLPPSSATKGTGLREDGLAREAFAQRRRGESPTATRNIPYTASRHQPSWWMTDVGAACLIFVVVVLVVLSVAGGALWYVHHGLDQNYL